MNDYTPKTHEIRAASVIHRAALIHRQMTGQTIRDAERVALTEFDRWLAEVERAAVEKGWDEGEIAGYEDALAEQRCIGPHERARNPYSKTKEENDDQA